MVWLLITFVIVVLMGGAFVVGFRLGGSHWYQELLELRLQAAQAERHLHELTRSAFEAMAEHAATHRTTGR
jgi:hypothetical protein